MRERKDYEPITEVPTYDMDGAATVYERRTGHGDYVRRGDYIALYNRHARLVEAARAAEVFLGNLHRSDGSFPVYAKLRAALDAERGEGES